MKYTGSAQCEHYFSARDQGIVLGQDLHLIGITAPPAQLNNVLAAKAVLPFLTVAVTKNKTVVALRHPALCIRSGDHDDRVIVIAYKAHRRGIDKLGRQADAVTSFGI